MQKKTGLLKLGRDGVLGYIEMTMKQLTNGKLGQENSELGKPMEFQWLSEHTRRRKDHRYKK